MGPLAGRTGAHEAIGQDLDRNIALQASVAGAVDDTHAAAAQLFEHFVRPDYLLHAINSVPFRSHLRRNQGFIQIITLSSGQSPGSSARNDGIGRSGTKESIMVVVPSGPSASQTAVSDRVPEPAEAQILCCLCNMLRSPEITPIGIIGAKCNDPRSLRDEMQIGRNDGECSALFHS